MAIALEKELHRLATDSARDQPLWPGFDPLTVPLAVYDGKETYLFRHPAPPPEFAPASGGDAGSHVFKGRHATMTANTNTELGGVGTATVLLDKPRGDYSLREMAAIAVHEAFHVYQRAHHPDWSGNEADLFTYPTDNIDLLLLRRLESEALRAALTAGQDSDAACWTRKALALRSERYEQMDAAFPAYERATELNEGLAAYVQMRAAGRSEVRWPAEGFGASEVRRRAYASGSALAMLLDRFEPGWQADLEEHDRQLLDSMLSESLGPGDVCSFADASVARVEDNARRDVAALVDGRTKRLITFEEGPGWRVVVEAAGEPLWPQGFDPINVQVLAAGIVLHTRFLQLGNGSGQLEVLNTSALTEAVGPHPLYQGIRRAVLTALEEPVVQEQGATVKVTAPGLTLEFNEASTARTGVTITVRLGLQ